MTVCISGSADTFVCMHRRGCGVDAFQSVTAEHCKDRVSLVHNQPPSSSAAAVTAPGQLQPHFTSFRRSRPWNLHRHVSMRSHVAKTVSACYSVLRQLRTIRLSVSRSVLQSLVSSLVLSQLDYGNSTLAGVSSRLVTAAVSDERRRSAYLFLVEVPAHHSAPSSAALAEGSRADCIQTISPRVQVSARVRTCIPY